MRSSALSNSRSTMYQSLKTWAPNLVPSAALLQRPTRMILPIDEFSLMYLTLASMNVRHDWSSSGVRFTPLTPTSG